MIISDSTTIITLINIDEFKLLKKFTNNIILTKEVYEEISINDNIEKKFIDNEIKTNYIIIKSYQNRALYEEINILLDNGESASISLALEKKLPLLIDEKKGRKLAQQLGVDIIGLVGIIRFLYIKGKIDHQQTLALIDKLNHSDFRISNKLMKLILEK